MTVYTKNKNKCFLLKAIDPIKLKKEGLIFVEIDLLMGTFCVNVTELFLTYCF